MYLKIGSIEIGKKPEQPDVLKEVNQALQDFIQKSSSWDKLFSYGMPMDLNSGIKVLFPFKDIASVYKSIMAICDNAPQAKISFLNAEGEEKTDSKDIEPLFLLFSKPNPKQTGNDFLQEWVGFYSLYGEAFIRKVKTLGNVAGTTKLPGQIINLNPASMKEVAASDNRSIIVAWKYNTSFGTETIPAEEIIHTKSFNPYNPLRGMSPLCPISDEVEIDQASLDFNKAFFLNDASPNFILSTDQAITKDQIDRLTKWIENRHKGSKNAFKPAVFEKGLKAQNLSNSHKDMDFIQQKKLMREEILGIWRSPKALFNITDDLNYATFQGQMKVFWLYTIMPILRKFEDSINEFLVKPVYSGVTLAFDYKNVPAFQEDLSNKVATAKTLFDIGFTANEINEKLELGFDEAEWRDEWWVPMGLTPAGETLLEPEEAEDDKKSESPKEKQDDEKAVLNPRHKMFLKKFLNTHRGLENRLATKIKRYFYELRTKVLSITDEELKKGIIHIDWSGQDEALVKYVKPLLEESIKQGVTIAQDNLGKSAKGVSEEEIQHAINSYLTLRCDRIKIVNRNLEKGIRRRIQESIQGAIEQGNTSGQMAESMLSLGEDIRKELREFFNSAGVRAKLISRTETTGAMNGGSLLYYDQEGIEKKEWITANDEFVRESHRDCEHQGTIPIDKAFKNGLKYPGDQDGDVSEIVNCRCTLAPVVLEE